MPFSAAAIVDKRRVNRFCVPDLFTSGEQRPMNICKVEVVLVTEPQAAYVQSDCPPAFAGEKRSALS